MRSFDQRTVYVLIHFFLGQFLFIGNANAADVTFSAKQIVGSAFNGAIWAFVADVDGDGDMDVLGAARDGDDIAWWENTAGDGSTWTQHTVDGTFDYAIGVHAADVDGDGDIDVLGAALNADDITWWENTAGDGSVWTEHTVDGAFDGANSIFAADIDGDSDLDILGSAGAGAGQVAWWENTAGNGTTWTEHTVDSAFLARASYAADVDGDGDIDVLGASHSNDLINWWENTAGDGSAWTEHTISAAFDGAFSVIAVDLDGDGDTDVLGAAQVADDITWWENTAGDGSAWTEFTIGGNFDSAFSVSAADIDNDGDIDVLGAAEIAHDVTWWDNTAGDGSAWVERTIDAQFDGARSVIATDLDGDGDNDVVSAGFYADQMAWWENLSILVDSDGDGV